MLNLFSMRTADDPRSGLENLYCVCEQMAASIGPLFAAPTLAQYQRFLNMMFHYTHQSGAELQHAASQVEVCAVAESAEYANVLRELAREEQGHFRLAEADLASLGARPSEIVPDEVIRLRTFWSRLGREDPNQYFGALFVLENVAGFVQTQALGALESLGLSFSQTRFVRAHLSEDAAHGAQIASLCRRQSEELLVHSAEETARLWVDMHIACVVD